MDNRGRKRRRAAVDHNHGAYVNLEDTDSDDVICSQFFDEDSYAANSSSDVEILSEDSSRGGSAIRNFNKTLYDKIIRDYKKIKALKREMTFALHAQSGLNRSAPNSSDGFTRQSVSKFSGVIGSLSEERKAVIRRYGFGSLLLFDKCFVPKKFSKWLSSLVEYKSGDLIVHGKVISLSTQSVNQVLGIPVGGSAFPSNYSNGKSVVLSKFNKVSLPQISFFANKLGESDLTDEEVLICFLIVALHCFLCPNSNIVPSPRYLGVFEDLDNISSYDWSAFVLQWLLDGIKSFSKSNKVGQRSSRTLGGCMYYLAVVYLDHVDFSHRQLPHSFPRIEVWKGNMITEYSELDMKSPSVYGLRPLLDYDKTCYSKITSEEPISAAEDISDLEFLSKLQVACGCDIPDVIKEAIISLIDQHCNSCLSPVPVDLLSLGHLSDEMKTLFTKLMVLVYQFKSKSRDLVLNALKIFADYECVADDNGVPNMSPVMPSHDNVVRSSNHNTPVAVSNVKFTSSSAKVPSNSSAKVGNNAAVSPANVSQSRSGFPPVRSSLKFHDGVTHQDASNDGVAFNLASSSQRPSSSSLKHVRFGSDGARKDILRVHPDIAAAKCTKGVLPNSSEDVIDVVDDGSSDSEDPVFHSPNHYVGPPVVMHSLPFTDCDSPRITPKLSKKVASSSGLRSEPKVSLPQAVPSIAPVNTQADCPGSSTKSEFKLSDSSTGGKVPPHGPRRTVVPNVLLRTDYQLPRGTFKVSKSQVANYNAICSLASSDNSGLNAVEFGNVRCNFWCLGESFKPDGIVKNFAISAFCYHLFSQPNGHPDVSKRHYCFASIGENLLKDKSAAKIDSLGKFFERRSRSRPLYAADMFYIPCFHENHWFLFVVDVKDRLWVFLDSLYSFKDDYQSKVRDILIENFQYWWKHFGLIDMGFHGYKFSYPYVPRQTPNNFADSGVYVMMFLENWKSPRTSLFSFFEQSDIPNLRIKFANLLLESPKNSGRKDLVSNYVAAVDDDN